MDRIEPGTDNWVLGLSSTLTTPAAMSAGSTGSCALETAVVPEIVDERFPFSQVRDANVLVFPSLDAANVAYKLLARLGNAEAIGPILLGMGAPVHVLQTGDDVRDIVDIAAVAVMDALGVDPVEGAR